MSDDQTDSKKSTECEQALKEIRIMLRYALAKGLALDADTSSSIATVESCQPSVTEPATVDLSKVLLAHSALVKLVAPATPRSLEATETALGFLASLSRPRLIPVMIIVALIAAIGFIATVTPPAPTSSSPPSQQASPQPTSPAPQPSAPPKTGTGANKPAAVSLVPAILAARMDTISLLT